MILITGGSGFLAGRLAHYLKLKGYKVRLGTRKLNSNLNNIFNDFEICEMDYFDLNSLNNACKKINTIFHLADINAQKSINNPELAIKINGIGTQNLLNSALVSGVKKFVQFSTVHVYGDALKESVTEDILPSPRHPYAITSRLAEDFVLRNVMSNLSPIVLRISNIVGAPICSEVKCWHLTANNFCKQAVQTQKIKIDSHSNIKRDFVPLKLLLKICEKILQASLDDKIWGNVFNISSGSPKSLEEIAKLIIKQYKILFKNQNSDLKLISSIGTNDIYKFQIKSDKAKEFNLIENTDNFYLEDDVNDLLQSCKKWFVH